MYYFALALAYILMQHTRKALNDLSDSMNNEVESEEKMKMEYKRKDLVKCLLYCLAYMGCSPNSLSLVSADFIFWVICFAETEIVYIFMGMCMCVCVVVYGDE